MKKKTLFGAALAFAGAAMMGATSTMRSTTQTTTVAEAAPGTGGNAAGGQPSIAQHTQSMAAVAPSIFSYGRGSYTGVARSTHRRWCHQPGSRGMNKIKRGRSVRRKNRRN